MGENYGNDLITVTDEDGGEYNLEHLATAEIGDEVYMAFLPADMDEDHEDYGLVILKVVDDDGEQSFVTPDEDVIEEIHGRFIELLDEGEELEYEDDDEEDDEDDYEEDDGAGAG